MKAICGCTVFPFIGALNVEMNAEFAMPAPNGAQLCEQILWRNFDAQLCS